jgi:hypothetical protein
MYGCFVRLDKIETLLDEIEVPAVKKMNNCAHCGKYISVCALFIANSN